MCNVSTKKARLWWEKIYRVLEGSCKWNELPTLFADIIWDTADVEKVLIDILSEKVLSRGNFNF